MTWPGELVAEQREFIALIDRIIPDLADIPPHLCSPIPSRSLPGDTPLRGGRWPRIVVGLEGHTVRIISQRGERRRVSVSPGHCIYFPPDSWDLEVWKSRGRVLGATLMPDFLRIVEVHYRGGEPMARFYHTAMPAPAAAMRVSQALDALAEEGSPGSPCPPCPWAADLFRVLLGMIREHLIRDQPADHVHGGAEITWRAVRHHLDEHFTETITRQSVAEALGIHESYLSALARRMTGRPFRAAMDEARMDRARTLLRRSKLKVAQIAVECGYSNEGNFINAFRRVVGITPGRFRKSAALMPDGGEPLVKSALPVVSSITR